MAGRRGDLLSCSFCGKTQKQVIKMIAGPGVYICDECIDLCIDIIVEEMSEEVGDEANAVAGRLRADLDELTALRSKKRQAP